MLEAPAFPYTRTTYSSTTHHPKLWGIKKYQVEAHFHTHEHHIPVQHIIPTLWGTQAEPSEICSNQPPFHRNACSDQTSKKKSKKFQYSKITRFSSIPSPLAQWIFNPLKNDKHPICKPVGFWWPARTLVHQTLFEHSGKKYVIISLPSFL